MATIKQIEYRLDQAKKKLSKLGKEVTVTRANISTLEAAFKKARVAKIARVAEMRRLRKLSRENASG